MKIGTSEVADTSHGSEGRWLLITVYFFFLYLVANYCLITTACCNSGHGPPGLMGGVN